MKTTSHTDNNPIKIEPEKYLKINSCLATKQNKLLLQMLQKYKKLFAWDYMDMKWIHPNLCTNHIYLKYGDNPIRQLQLCMNLTLKEVVKEEL